MTSTEMGRTERKGREMPCYNPLVRVEDLTKWVKAKDGHKYHPAKVYSTRDIEKDRYFFTGYTKSEIIPCGNCIGCRLDYSRRWANRGYLEAQTSHDTWFVTLTHDDEHHFIPEEIILSDTGKIIIPNENEKIDGITFTEIEEIEWKGCLIPQEMVTFMKSLRQIMKREYKVDGIRFILCGEYGTINKREHYHLILYNCPLPPETFYNPRIDWKHEVYYQNTIIERAWSREESINGKKKLIQKGIINICEANWNTIAYVARYITKKVNGKESELHYAVQGEVKEFFRTSRNKGIGYDYYIQNKEKIYKNDKIMIVNHSGTHYTTPPKYYDDMYEKENPTHMKLIKEQRKKRQLYNLRAKAMTTSLTAWEQLQVEMAYKEESIKALQREL